MDFTHIFHVACFTFLQAACSTVIALLIGLPAAFFCGRRVFPGRKLLLSVSVVPFCIPSLIIALGYVTFLGVNGGLNQLLMFVFGLKNPPVRILYTFYGLIIAQGFYNFPLIMKNVSDAWESLPSEPAESARLLGAKENRIFCTVTLYQLMPSIASASLLVFIYCFLSFILVLLFGGVGNSTLEVEIYKAARATLDFRQVGILAAIETSILCVMTILYGVLEQKAEKRTKGIKTVITLEKRKIKSAGEIISFIILLILIVLFFISPLAGIVVNSFTTARAGVTKGPAGFTLTTFRRVFKMKTFMPSLKNTLWIACCTGFLCTFTAFVYSVFARFLERKRKDAANLILKVLPMIPMAVSSVVAGVLITIMVKRGNCLCLILAQTALNWPLAYKVIFPQLSKISDETLDAAKILSSGRIDTVIRVILPMSTKSLFTAFGYSFAVSAGDTTLPLVLAIPKLNTLSLFTYRLAGAYRFNEACASGLILGLICAIVFALATVIRKK